MVRSGPNYRFITCTVREIGSNIANMRFSIKAFKELTEKLEGYQTGDVIRLSKLWNKGGTRRSNYVPGPNDTEIEFHVWKNTTVEAVEVLGEGNVVDFSRILGNANNITIAGLIHHEPQEDIGRFTVVIEDIDGNLAEVTFDNPNAINMHRDEIWSFTGNATVDGMYFVYNFTLLFIL